MPAGDKTATTTERTVVIPCHAYPRLAGHERVVVTVAGPGQDLLAGFGAPFRRPHQTGRHHVQAAHQRENLFPAADEHARGRRVVDPSSGAHLRSGIRGAVGERDVTARRERRQQRADDGGRIIRVGQEVQHGDEQDARRFVKVDQTPQFRVGQDTGRRAHVVPDDDRVGCALQHVPGVREHYRVVIHVDDARSRVGGHRHLVYVPPGRQAGANVNQLPDAGLVHQVADRAAHEGAVDLGGFAYIGQIRRDLITRIPVRGIIIFAAQEIVVNSR